MSGKYNESLIEEVIQSNDIIDVISQYVSLKKTGKNYKGLCPFHNEKTPSFFVSDDKKLYHCFGCGESGNIINFIMSVENLDFLDALESLADRANINLTQYKENNENNEIYKKRKILYDINREAAIYFYKNLGHADNSGLNYLRSRGYDKDIIKTFGLGYAKDEWEDLKKYLLKKGFDLNDIYESGLIIQKKDGNGYYDRFRNRVVFPIIMPPKKIVGFGGRVLDNSLPKYLNSPESIIFNKSNILYGLNLARSALGTDKSLILVEGYTDVISLYQHGIKNVVATLGTSLTKSHGELLRRYCEEVVIAFDSDTAGESATIRGLDILDKVGCKVKVLRLGKNMDPDEFIRKYGQKKFAASIKEAPILLDYKIELSKKKFDLKTNEGKINFIKESIKILKPLIKSPIELDIYVRKLSEETDVPTNVIKSEIYGNNRDEKKYLRYKRDSSFNNNAYQQSKNMIAISKIEKNGTQEVEKNIISLSLSSKTNYNTIKNYIDNNDYINSKFKKVFNTIGDNYLRNEKIDFEELMEKFDIEEGRFVNEALHTSIPSDDLNTTVKELIISLKIFSIEDDIKNTKNEIKVLQSKENKNEGDVKREKELCMKLMDLVKRLRDVRIN